MTVSKMDVKLARFYPAKPDDSRTQKAWRKARSCSVDAPCGLSPCSACSAAAGKLILDQAWKLNAGSDESELIRITFERTVKVSKMTLNSFAEFQSKILSAVGRSELGDLEYVGAFSIDPVWNDVDRYRDGPDLAKCQLCLEIYLQCDSYYQREWILDQATQIPGWTGAEAISDKPKFNLGLHNAKRQASKDFYFSGEFACVSLADCFVNVD